MFSSSYAKLKHGDVRKLLKNLLSLAVLRGFDFLIPLITFPYIISKIGIDKFGLISFSLSLCVYFGAIIQYGFSLTGTRDIARSKSDLFELERIYSNIIWTTTFLFVVCLIFFSILVLFIPKFNDYSLLYFVTFLSISLRSLFPIWFFQGVEEMKYITYLGLLSKLLFVVCLFIFVKTEQDFLFIPILNSVSAGVLLLSSVYLIRWKFSVSLRAPKFAYISKQLKHGRYAFINQFAPNLYSNSAIFLLGIFTNTNVVGVFTAASKVIDVAGSVAYIFSNAFLPYISRKIETHKSFMRIMLAVALTLCTFLFLCSDLIVSFLYGEKIESPEISFYLKLLTPAIALIFLQLTLSTNFLMLVGQERLVKNITLSVSVFSLLYTFPAIYFFGGYGAVFTLIFTRVIMSSFYIYGYKSYFKEVGVRNAI